MKISEYFKGWFVFIQIAVLVVSVNGAVKAQIWTETPAAHGFSFLVFVVRNKSKSDIRLASNAADAE